MIRSLLKALFAGFVALLMWHGLIVFAHSMTAHGDGGSVWALWWVFSPITAPAVAGAVCAWYMPTRWYIASAAGGVISAIAMLLTTSGLGAEYVVVYAVVTSLLGGLPVWLFVRWLRA
ncbi:MAG: hypothetical protein EAZ43_11010 [Betaproteobacteria bacterium]|nr:MAG: hypothetical protein EAZ43_11010 [Betaproteobacteria bacterium]